MNIRIESELDPFSTTNCDPPPSLQVHERMTLSLNLWVITSVELAFSCCGKLLSHIIILNRKLQRFSRRHLLMVMEGSTLHVYM